MATLIDSLNSGVSEILEAAPKLKSVGKDDLREYLNMLMSKLTAFTSSIDNMDNKTRSKFVSLLQEMAGGNSIGANLYNVYASKLRGKAKDAESKVFLASLETAAKQIAGVLDNVESQLDDLFKNESISIYNTKLSHVAIFGALGLAKTVGDMAVYLLHAVTATTFGEFDDVPRYRIDFINNKAQDVANAVNKLYEASGMDKLLVVISSLKKNNQDIQLVDENNNVNSGFVRVGDLRKTEKEMLLDGLGRLNIFRILGELWNNFRHDLALRTKSDKEWMEAQVSLLKLQMSDVADEKEKAKLEKIIKYYSEQIAKADRKLNKYFGS